VKSEEKLSRSSFLSRNKTVVEKISRWKRSFPEQNEKFCEKYDVSQFQGPKFLKNSLNEWPKASKEQPELIEETEKDDTSKCSFPKKKLQYSMTSTKEFLRGRKWCE
jgi:hypothetical protein